MLVAYLDESGTHDGSRITAVGGFVGHAETWETVEEKWQSALSDFAEAGITAFHAAECENGDGEFANLPRELRIALFNRLARILRDSDLLGTWCAVINQDWHTLDFEPAFRRAFPKPYYLCFAEVARKLARWADRRADGWELELVYSEQTEFEPRSREIWEEYNRSDRGGRLRSFSSASYRDRIPLQCADLLAYELNCDWQAREYRPDPSPFAYRVRRPLHIIRTGGGLDASGCYDAHAIQMAIKRFNETGEV